MNLPPLNDEQQKVRLIKKDAFASSKHGEIKKVSSLTPSNTPSATPSGGSVTAVPAPKSQEAKVQLVEVEPGVYDIYFTCSCCEQYIVRCESLDHAAKASVPPSSSV